MQSEAALSEARWRAHASAEIQEFLRVTPLVARTREAPLLLEALALLTWELRRQQAAWVHLPLHEFFRRLRIEQDFIVTPERVAVSYDAFSVLLVWLADTQRIGPKDYQRLRGELHSVRTPLVDEARRLLQTRREANTRHGVWHEVLKTMGGP